MEDSKRNTHSKKENENTELEKIQSESSATLLEEMEPDIREILDKLEPEEKKIISTSMYSGPLPPPEILHGYTEIYPDAPEKIFSWVETQQKHRHELEKKSLKISYFYQLTGMILGFFIAMIFVIGAFLLILYDKEIYGVSLLGPTFIGLAGLFIVHNKKKSSDTNEKKDEDKETGDND